MTNLTRPKDTVYIATIDALNKLGVIIDELQEQKTCGDMVKASNAVITQIDLKRELKALADKYRIK